MPDSTSFLSKILDSDFLESLAKSANLYKIGSNSTLDPEEIRIGLKVVPRAVMSMLISELTPMQINSSKDVVLPFGENAYIRCNKNAADDYTGSVYSKHKLVYDFQNRSIPGLGIILLSTFELYDLEELKKPYNSPDAHSGDTDDIDHKIQRLIDERMELHSLVNRVVENKMAEREAIHKMMMVKLSEAINTPVVSKPIPPTTNYSPSMLPIKPINIEAKDITKKEAPFRKGSPLKEFLDRKKKPKTYSVEMAKSEQINCNDCGQEIFGKGQQIAACLCYGENMGSKLWLKKSDDGIQIRFSKNWTPENIEMLLETLRTKK